jgi:hypothetical protein
MKTLLMVGAVLGILSNEARAAWLAPDFHVADSELAKAARGERKAPKARVADPASCGDRIASLICLVDPRDPANPEAERECLAGGEPYAVPFQKVFSSLTPTFQEMFCSIDRIFVEKKLGATGYAGVGEGGSVHIGIRQTVLDTELSFQKWATWKEQLSFGGLRDSYEPTAGLSFFVLTPVTGVSDFLYQFLVHEFGHQFDFANAVNAQEARCAEDEEQRESCPFQPGTWGSLSWHSPELPLFENDFPGRRSFCFYGCGIVTASEQAPSMYRGLWDSNFINAYAATNPYDDFADGLAYYAADQYLGQRISIDDGQGTRYDLTSKLKSGRFRKKLQYIEKFLGRNDIKYP